MKRYYVFMALLIVVTVAAAVAQSMLGRGVKADQKLADNISSFDNKIQNYAGSHNVLPTAAQAGGVPAGVTYTALTESTFKLCGNFNTENKDPSPDVVDKNNAYINTTYHEKGYVCFNGSVTIDPPVVQPLVTPSPVIKHPVASPIPGSATNVSPSPSTSTKL